MIDIRKKIVHIVLDYTASRQTFGLYLDPQTDMLVTFPKPKASELHLFYQSQQYISHTDARTSLLDIVYQWVKKYAIAKKIAVINSLHPTKGQILDIGAGTGDFAAAASRDGWEVTAVEPSASAAALAQQKKIQCQQDSTKLLSNAFDVITMWHVLEHVPDLEKQITELKRLLKPNGTIFVAVPNYKSFDAKHYGRFWAAFDVPRHLWHFSKNSIKAIFGTHGMILQDCKPMFFDAFYVSILSEKYKNGRTNLFKAIFTGFKSNLKARKSGQYSSLIYIIKNKL